MHNIISNANLTEGNVRILVKKGDTKLREINLHNSGTIDLCRYIRDALSGEYVVNNRPGIIIPCEYIDGYGDYNLKDMFSVGIDATNIVSKTDSGESGDVWAGVTLSCIIPETVLPAGKIIGGFKLFNVSSNRKLYAWIDIHKTSPITIIPGTNIEIEWTLKISPFTKGGE